MASGGRRGEPMIKVSEDERPRSTKNIHFYKSGDQSFTGVKLPINSRKYRTLDALLDDLSIKVPGLSYGCRRLATPSGRHQITQLHELEHLGNYVCSDKLSAKKVAGVDIAKLPGAGFDSGFRGQFITTPRAGDVTSFRAKEVESPLRRTRSQPSSLRSTLSVPAQPLRTSRKKTSPRRRDKSLEEARQGGEAARRKGRTKARSKSPTKPPSKKRQSRSKSKSRSPHKRRAVGPSAPAGGRGGRARTRSKVPPLPLSKSSSPPKRRAKATVKSRSPTKRKPPQAPRAEAQASPRRRAQRKPRPPRRHSLADLRQPKPSTNASPRRQRKSKSPAKKPKPKKPIRSPSPKAQTSRRPARPESVESFGVSSSAPTTPSEKRRSESPADLGPLDEDKLKHVQRRRIVSKEIDADDFRYGNNKASSKTKPKGKGKKVARTRGVASPLRPPKQDYTDEEAVAATRIQAGFRGYKTRKTLKEEKAATKIQAGVRGHQTRRKLKEDQAATKIQAQYRGYRTRKQMRGPTTQTIAAPRQLTREPTENLIDHVEDGESLNDSRPASTYSPPNTPPPNVQAHMDADQAATKIQAHYKGYRTRKEYLKYADDASPSARKSTKSSKSTSQSRRRRQDDDQMSFLASDEDDH